MIKNYLFVHCILLKVITTSPVGIFFLWNSICFKVCATNITLFIGYSTDSHAKKRKLRENAVLTRFNISSENQAANIQSFDRIVCVINYLRIFHIIIKILFN